MPVQLRVLTHLRDDHGRATFDQVLAPDCEAVHMAHALWPRSAGWGHRSRDGRLAPLMAARAGVEVAPLVRGGLVVRVGDAWRLTELGRQIIDAALLW